MSTAMEPVRRESSRQSKSSSTGGGKNRLSRAYSSYIGAKSGRTPTSKLSKSVVAAGDDEETVNGFSGIFSVPEAGCTPNPPAELTKEQQAKYDEVLKFFQQKEKYATSLKDVNNTSAKQTPLNDWEKLRMLSKESMLRYLRATKWDVKQAEKRLIDTIAWRREFGMDDLDPDEMAKEARSGKETVLGYDNCSRPLHYMHPHRNDTKESPRQMQFAVWILERCIDVMPPGVEQLALLINFEHRSRNPTSIANAKLMLYILQNHYVERLGIALCINVPWVFKMFWNAIQAFIDPVTKSKCRFDEAVKTEVPLAQLSTDFGGDLDATYKHDEYWPALVAFAKERREQMIRRFKEDCNSEIGASEWVIRGGNDSTSPFNQGKKGANGEAVHATKTSESMGTSTDTSSVAPDLTGSDPIERFKTPNEFPPALLSEEKASTKVSGRETPVENAAAMGHASDDVESQPSSPNAKKQSSSVFKDMDRKFHASKLFAAFHPDSRKHQQESTEYVTAQELPSANEIAAVAGTAGATAAVGAIGSVLADQASVQLMKAQSYATTELARITSPTKNEKEVLEELPSVTVLFFAAAKDAMGGKGKHTIVLPFHKEQEKAIVSPMTMASFRAHLLENLKNYPPSPEMNMKQLEKVIAQSKWSIDEDLLDEEDMEKIQLKGGEDVAIIPPVSGG